MTIPSWLCQCRIDGPFGTTALVVVTRLRSQPTRGYDCGGLLHGRYRKNYVIYFLARPQCLCPRGATAIQLAIYNYYLLASDVYTLVGSDRCCWLALGKW